MDLSSGMVHFGCTVSVMSRQSVWAGATLGLGLLTYTYFTGCCTESRDPTSSRADREVKEPPVELEVDVNSPPMWEYDVKPEARRGGAGSNIRVVLASTS